MPTLRQECLECLAADIESHVNVGMEIPTNNVDDIYHDFLDGLDDNPINFWTINHSEDDLSKEDFMTLIQICAQNLYPPGVTPRGWVTGDFCQGSLHMHCMLQYYYKHVCIETKVWICEIIQETLNKV